MSPLRLNGSTSGNVSLDAPAVAGNNTLVLPGGNGTNGQYLQTNGSGALSWSTVTSSKILQVVQAFKSDTFTTSSTSFVDLTGLSVSITPASASNKILVQCFMTGGCTTAGPTTLFRITRDATGIAIADAAGSRPQGTTRFAINDTNHGTSTSACFLDSPATTSSITYKVQVRAQSGFTSTINRTGNDSDGGDAYQARTTSNIIVMEVAP